MTPIFSIDIPNIGSVCDEIQVLGLVDTNRKNKGKISKMNSQKKVEWSFATIVIALVFFAALAATAMAFIGPVLDPSTAGFRSPCAFALSKDDGCTFDRATDSLEAIRDKINSLTPE